MIPKLFFGKKEFPSEWYERNIRLKLELIVLPMIEKLYELNFL